MEFTARRRALTAALFNQLMSWSDRDIRELEQQFQDALSDRSFATAMRHRAAPLELADEDDDDEVNTSNDENGDQYSLWYYRRRGEMLHAMRLEDRTSVLCASKNEASAVAELRERMEQLEEDMESARIDEGTYLERADKLRDEYQVATRSKEQVVAGAWAVAATAALHRVRSVPHIVVHHHEVVEEVD